MFRHTRRGRDSPGAGVPVAADCSRSATADLRASQRYRRRLRPPDLLLRKLTGTAWDGYQKYPKCEAKYRERVGVIARGVLRRTHKYWGLKVRRL
jgi:hypothetical protein